LKLFYRRKFNYDSEDYPKFMDIQRKYYLDVELEASGFTKQMEIDLNKAYDSGNFLAHCEDAAKRNITDSHLAAKSEREENTSSSYESESECSTISEVGEDKEGLRKEEELRENEAKLLSRSERFTNWLGEATLQLEHLIVEQIGPSEDEHPMFTDTNSAEKLQGQLIGCEPNIQTEECPERINTEESRILFSSEKPKLSSTDRSIRATLSLMSTSSTIPLEEIKRRVALEKLRNKEKNKIRVKGKQSAVQRGRKENRFTINDYKGWI
ncbi:hypothetical protein Angca_007506, partial [Angiostrongylus cantonensis]